MSTFILAGIVSAMLGWLMGFLSFFLILLILVQRGRGGGLTGALGGPGGQSAFGSKAGDTFTLITIVVASIWGFTCAFAMWKLGTHAPTTTMETNIAAGPGDDIEEDPTSGIVIPKSTGAESGLSGFGDPNTTTETPSMQLQPKQPETTETPAESERDGKASDTTGQAKPAGDETPAEGEPKTESTPAEASSSQGQSDQSQRPDGNNAETTDADPSAAEGDKKD